MDSETKKIALDKLEKIVPIIGYSDDILKNSTKLDSYHKNLEFESKNDLLINLLLLENEKKIERINHPNVQINLRDVYEVNAYYRSNGENYNISKYFSI